MSLCDSILIITFCFRILINAIYTTVHDGRYGPLKHSSWLHSFHNIVEFQRVIVDLLDT